MRLFVSHAHEQAAIADALTIALRQEHHTVFLDRDALKPGRDYHAKIREEIRRSDLLVFLVSPQSVEAGGYALTEMALLRERWPDPTGHVLPVLAVSTPAIPEYLAAVTILHPQGNLVAETVARIRDMQAEADACAARAKATADARRWRKALSGAAVASAASLLAGGVWWLDRRPRVRRPCLVGIQIAGPSGDGEPGGVTTLDVGPPGALRPFVVTAGVANVDVSLTGPRARWTIEPSTGDGRRLATFEVEGCPSAPAELRDDAAKVVMRMEPR